MHTYVQLTHNTQHTHAQLTHKHKDTHVIACTVLHQCADTQVGSAWILLYAHLCIQAHNMITDCSVESSTQ